MERLFLACQTFMGRYSVTSAAPLAAFAVAILVSALRALACAADQPLGLSVHGLEVIRIAEEQQNVRVYDLAFSPRPGLPVCAFALERAVQVWDLSAKPRVITTLTPPVPTNVSPDMAAGVPHPIAFSSDGARLAMGYFGVQVWDFDRRRIQFAVPIFPWDPEAVRFSAADSTLIIGCSHYGFLNIHTAGQPLRGKIEILSRGEYERIKVADPSSFRMDPDDMRRVRAKTAPDEEKNIYCLAVSPDGKWFIAGGDSVLFRSPRDRSIEPSVTVWDIGTGRRTFSIGDREVPILRFCLSPNGRVLYSCGNKVLGWDTAKSAPPIHEFDADGRRMISICVSPDATMLAAGGQDGTVVIWHVDSTRRLATLKHNGGPVYGLAFSQDARKLVAAGERGMATVWDVEILPRR
jgi:WD40 repeat protein